MQLCANEPCLDASMFGSLYPCTLGYGYSYCVNSHYLSVMPDCYRGVFYPPASVLRRVKPPVVKYMT